MAIRLSGMASGMDTDSLVQELVKVQRLKNKTVTDQKTLYQWKKEKYQDLNTKLYKLYTNDLAKLKTQGSFLEKTVSVSNESYLSASAGINAPVGAHNIEIKKVASSQYVTSGQVELTSDTKLVGLTNNGATLTAGSKLHFGNVEFEIKDTSTVNDLLTQLNSSGFNANYDEANKRFFISAKENGTAFEVKATNPGGTDNNNLLNAIGFDAVNVNNGSVVVSGTLAGMSLVAPSQSVIMYNGAELKSNTNVVTVNGLTLNLKGAKEGEQITLTVASDTKAAYDTIKNFVKSYNSILDEMNKLYYAGSSKGYAPLSDDEKSAMSEKDIENWETKIKNSILRRDSTVGGVITSMKSILNESLTINDGTKDKRYSLSSFGIMTSANYLEKGLLHIFGDEDDPAYSLQSDKLLKGIEEDPDGVMKFFNQLGDNLYKDISNKLKSIPNVKSSLVFYNDKTLDKRISEYEVRISKLENKLLLLEEKYYKQFSSMETALSKLQSQSNSLLSMLG